MKIEVEFDVPEVRLTVLRAMVSCGASCLYVKAVSDGLDVECVVQDGAGRTVSDEPCPYGQALAIAGRCVQARETERLAVITAKQVIVDQVERDAVGA